MPNGGEHYERLGICPLCGSPNIRIRRQRHHRLLWRCRRCNRVFRTPKVAEHVIPPGHDGSGLVHAESIPQMERRGRRRGRRSSTAPKLIAATILVIVVVAVAYLVFVDGSGLDIGGSGQRPSPEEFVGAAAPQSPTPILAVGIPTPIPTDTPTPTHTPHTDANRHGALGRQYTNPVVVGNANARRNTGAADHQDTHADFSADRHTRASALGNAHADTDSYIQAYANFSARHPEHPLAGKKLPCSGEPNFKLGMGRGRPFWFGRLNHRRIGLHRCW